MRRQRVLDGPDHVVAGVFAVQHDVVAQHGAGAHVDDDQQPDALDLEFLLEAQRIAHDDLQPHIQAVTVELDDLVGADRGGARRLRRMRQPLELEAPAACAAQP